MLKFIGFTLTLFFFFFQTTFVPNVGCAAQKGKMEVQTLPGGNVPAARAGDEVKTEFFWLKIPSGWIMPYPVSKKHKPEGIAAVFSDEKSGVAVTLNAIQTPLSLKNFTDAILGEMKKSGINPGMPVLEKGLNKITITGIPQGEAWLGSNGKLCTATVILSEYSNISAANELLQVLQSPYSQLFPKKLR